MSKATEQIKKHKEQDQDPVPYVLSVTAAAQQMGVHRSTIYELIKERGLPAFKYGRRTLIRRDLLFAFIDKMAEEEKIIV